MPKQGDVVPANIEAARIQGKSAWQIAVQSLNGAKK